MKDINWGNIIWIALKVIIGLVVLGALLMLVGSIFRGISQCLKDNPWVGWVLSTAVLIVIIWLNIEDKKNR